MRAVDLIVERRLREARQSGYFDDLPGAGKPIADLDRHREPGWWARRLIKAERGKLKALRIEDEVAAAMPALWRLGDEAAVRTRVGELNTRIEARNRLADVQPMPLLAAEAVLAQWRRFRPE